MRILDAVVLALGLIATVLALLRWLRVAQGEHYLSGEVLRFAAKWWGSAKDNEALAVVGALGAIGGILYAPAALVAEAVAAVGPKRLSIRGRTSRLVWTRRMCALGFASTVVEAVFVAAGAAAGGLGGAAAATGFAGMVAPIAVELALLVTYPLEELVARRYVARAVNRLDRVRPLVVAVTGSYGKTTVKGYLVHLVGPYRATLASPRSFNNRAGLARTVNEHLGPATEVLVAEMGTYGPGEIAEMCSWLRPEISIVTAIGPAHLQRFKSLDRTVAAKAEIADGARVVVLNVDDERLGRLAQSLRRAGKIVVGVSGRDPSAEVAVVAREAGLELHLESRRVGLAAIGPSQMPVATSNVACAAAVALQLGVAPEAVLARLPTLPVAANRLERYLAHGGYVVFDDTFNSNPSGASAGLSRLRDDPEIAPTGRRVVVTPGMVELGGSQRRENADLGAEAARVADRLIVVARTNRRALLEGAGRVDGGAVVAFVDRLDEALDWVRGNLGPGDAVLYENDLPDHFP